MGDFGKGVHLLNKLDFRQDSKLDCPVSSRLGAGIDSFESKLALRASLRYTGEDDQWQTKCRSLRDRNKYMFNRELFSDVRFLVGRREKTSIPAHRYILAISSPVFSSLFYAFGALQSEFSAREQVSKHTILFNNAPINAKPEGRGGGRLASPWEFGCDVYPWGGDLGHWNFQLAEEK